MTPKRPYLVRALHEWIEDNEFTAYLMVDANHPDLVAPTQYAHEGRLVLSVSYQATHNLQIDNDSISFAARFSGISENLWIPMQAVMGIYAKEAPEHALFFSPDEYTDYEKSESDSNKSTNKLRILD